MAKKKTKPRKKTALSVADRVRAHRQRQKEAGLQKIELHVTPAIIRKIDLLTGSDSSRSETIMTLVKEASKNPSVPAARTTGKLSVPKQKAVAAKSRVKKQARSKKSRKPPPVEIIFDAAGLERPAGFTDHAFAVRYSTMIETFYPKEYLDAGKSMGFEHVKRNEFTSAKNAQKMIEEFRATHANCLELKVTYVPPKKDMLKLTAIYEHPQPDHQLELIAQHR